MLYRFFLLTLLSFFLCSCGGPTDPDWTSDLVTVVVGAGEKADEPQPAISSIDSLMMGDKQLLGTISMKSRGEAMWNYKDTIRFNKPINAGTEAVLTVSGPAGSVDIDLEFTDGMFRHKEKVDLGESEIEAQSYRSVGDKWGIVVYVRPQE